MKNYEVTVISTGIFTYYVTAENQLEAEEAAWDRIDPSDFNYEYTVEEAEEL